MYVYCLSIYAVLPIFTCFLIFYTCMQLMYFEFRYREVYKKNSRIFSPVLDNISVKMFTSEAETQR